MRFMSTDLILDAKMYSRNSFQKNLIQNYGVNKSTLGSRQLAGIHTHMHPGDLGVEEATVICIML